LDSFSGFNSYAFVFALSAMAGTLDVLCFFAIKFPPMAAKSGEKPEKFMRMAARVIKNKSYMKFIAFMALWQFSVNISGPFYYVYLKNVVFLSNTLITGLIQILPSVCSIIVIRRWGRAIDLHGNKSIMQLTNGILSIAPFLWIFVPANMVAVPIIAVIALMQGCLFAGFEISANNIMLGHAPRENRSMYIAIYFTATSMLGIGLANATGGWLLENVFSVLERGNLTIFGVAMTRYNFIFALTAVLRFIMIYIALPRLIKEENNTPVRELLRGGFARMKSIIKFKSGGI